MINNGDAPLKNNKRLFVGWKEYLNTARFWGSRCRAVIYLCSGFYYTFCCNDTHCTQQKAHAICSYCVINVSVQVTIRPRTWQWLRVCHHHLLPRPESIFDKRQLRSEAIRCGMDVYGERVITADSHETWHWWVDHVRPLSIH